jgi:hypothetical protein
VSKTGWSGGERRRQKTEGEGRENSNLKLTDRKSFSASRTLHALHSLSTKHTKSSRAVDVRMWARVEEQETGREREREEGMAGFSLSADKIETFSSPFFFRRFVCCANSDCARDFRRVLCLLYGRVSQRNAVTERKSERPVRTGVPSLSPLSLPLSLCVGCTAHRRYNIATWLLTLLRSQYTPCLSPRDDRRCTLGPASCPTRVGCSLSLRL